MSWSWSNQPVLWDFYIMFLFVCYYFLSKAWRDRRCLTSYYLDLSFGLLRKTGGKSLHALVGLLLLELKCTSTLSCRRFCEVYWEYRTAGHLVFWKPRPAVELKKVLSVTNTVSSSEPSVNQTLDLRSIRGTQREYSSKPLIYLPTFSEI